MADRPLPSIIETTALNPAAREDPYPILKDLQARCPVHRDSAMGVSIVSRYADVRDVLGDRTIWRNPHKAEEAAVLTRSFVQPAPGEDVVLDRHGEPLNSILMLDDPDHARIRQPLTQAFYARAARWKPQVEAIVDAALDAIDTSKPFDLMSAFCIPIPIDVIASILGVDQTRLPEFRRWSEGVILFFDPVRTPEQTALMVESQKALRAYLLGEIDARRRRPKDDLITDMVQAVAQGVDIDDEELGINFSALLVGGNLTTTDLIGNAVWNMMQKREAWDALVADPGLAKSVVEETLRFEPPVDVTGRVASRDMEIAGCPVKKTQSIMFSLRAANRDPRVFDRPDEFDVKREHVPHVAFGGGAHICIGAPLARMEAQVGLAKLASRFPNLRLADPGAKPQWRGLPFFRGLERLDVVTG